jgi:hypothetical protein
VLLRGVIVENDTGLLACAEEVLGTAATGMAGLLLQKCQVYAPDLAVTAGTGCPVLTNEATRRLDRTALCINVAGVDRATSDVDLLL